MATPYRKRKNATPWDTSAGGLPRLRCDRCGRILDPWGLARLDKCSPPSWALCIRALSDVLTAWRKYNPAALDRLKVQTAADLVSAKDL